MQTGGIFGVHQEEKMWASVHGFKVNTFMTEAEPRTRSSKF